MNFLAHLWLAERAQLPLAGAILGDYLRGALPPDMPGLLAASVRLHRRIDAVTDAHARVVAARRTFGPGARRYAGILLDVLFDHLLAQDWREYSGEPLTGFADRAARAIALETRWFAYTGHAPPEPSAFAALLVSYESPDGFERAIARTASRLRRPQGLLAAMQGWRDRVALLRQDLPHLLADLGRLQPPEPERS